MPGKPKILTRRRFFKSLGLATLGAASAGAYGNIVESKWLDVGQVTVPLRKNPRLAPLKVLQLSDLHAAGKGPLDFIGDAIGLGLQEKPDLIVLTGDFITSRYDRWEEYAQKLSTLSATAPTYAVLGNHDGGRWGHRIGGYKDTVAVEELLAASKITLLENKSAALTLRDWKLNLVGLADCWAKDMRPDQAFGDVSKEEDRVTLVLSHNPDTKQELRPYGWDLMLSGHTHGGQLELPFLGTPFAPVKDKRYVKGLHHWDERWLHVTKGVGSLYGMRINCRPEVSLLTLA